MSVQDLINMLMRLNLDRPIVVWEQGCNYPIEITKKQSYILLCMEICGLQKLMKKAALLLATYIHCTKDVTEQL